MFERLTERARRALFSSPATRRVSSAITREQHDTPTLVVRRR